MFAQLPMYQERGKSAFNAKLDNIQSFSALLDHPEKKFKSIHVAGTNGKGSSSHMLASILQEAGYAVGLYTSPHLKDFRERIRINGKPIEKQFVVDFIKKYRPYLEKQRLSFFEMTVGMAFDYFVYKKIDIAIVEVGLGGRLDSTNIIEPEVSLITNIGFDHVDILGDTLEKIAREKGGIIKNNIPIVISEYQEEIADTFISLAQQHNSKIIFADKEIHNSFTTSLLGNYQFKNMKGVLAVLGELSGFQIEQTHIKSGLQKVVENTRLMGRWQILGEAPKVVCDTAHNSEGLSYVLQQISQQEFKALHIVLGFVKEKNLDVILPLFPVNAIYYYARPDIPRGLDVEVLFEKANEIGLKGTVFNSVRQAYDAALKNASKDDFIFIGGSTFVVAEVV
jgi:dihydrofolate synthase/folylpolyglutamate synthase